jgi:molybdopterin-guanine dinucleotide biosynthesis protein A
MKIGGVIVAGGKATRMGGKEKLLLQLGGKSVLEIILPRVRPQVDSIAIDVRNSSRHEYASWLTQDVAILSDPFVGKVGPLGGIVGGLQWLTTLSQEFEWLATFPGDTPFLPRDLIPHLKSFLRPGSSRPVVARDQEGVQSLCALWPIGCLRDLRQGVQHGYLRSVRGTLDEFDALQCPFPFDRSFININTERDLAEAEGHIEEPPQMLSSK